MAFFDKKIDTKGGKITSAAGVIANSTEGSAQAVSNLRSINLPLEGNPIGRWTSPISAENAIQGLSGTSLGSVSSSLNSVIPKAANMRTIARVAEEKAQLLLDNAVYNTYKTIFDNIETIAQAGGYSYSVQATQLQIGEFSSLLIKNGYTLTNITDSTQYTLRISW